METLSQQPLSDSLVKVATHTLSWTKCEKQRDLGYLNMISSLTTTLDIRRRRGSCFSLRLCLRLSLGIRLGRPFNRRLGSISFHGLRSKGPAASWKPPVLLVPVWKNDDRQKGGKLLKENLAWHVFPKIVTSRPLANHDQSKCYLETGCFSRVWEPHHKSQALHKRIFN